MEENKNNEIEVNSKRKQANELKVQSKRKLRVIDILVVIIVMLLLMLVLCIGNMYAMTKDYKNVFSMVSSMISRKEYGSGENNLQSKEENDWDNNEEIATRTIKENPNRDYVYQRESYDVEINDRGEIFKDKIEIPYININSEDAKKANQEIYKMYEEAVKIFVEEEQADSYTSISYKYSIFDNIVSLCIDSTPICIPGGGFVRERTVYNLNLEDGKRLSTNETLEKFDLTEDKLIEKINLKLKEMYRTKDMLIECTEDEYINGFEYDINALYFESNKNVELLLGGESVPYGDADIKIDISNYIYVSESYDFEYSYLNELYKKCIERPYINIHSEDAKKANQEINTIYKEAIKSTSNIKEKEAYKYLQYEYSIIENLLCLRISDWWIQIGSEGTCKDTIYYFNLENGKRLSMQEILKKLNLTEEKLIQNINTHLKEQYKKGEGIITEGMTEKQYIKSFKYDINEVFLKSDKIFEITVDSDFIENRMNMTINI